MKVSSDKNALVELKFCLTYGMYGKWFNLKPVSRDEI